MEILVTVTKDYWGQLGKAKHRERERETDPWYANGRQNVLRAASKLDMWMFCVSVRWLTGLKWLMLEYVYEVALNYFPIQLYLTGFYNTDLTLRSPVVTIYTASLTFNNSTFCTHIVFMCFVWISEQTAIISLYNINWLFIARKEMSL